MIFNELGFTAGTVALGALVAVVFFLQVRAVADDSIAESSVTAASQTAAVLSSTMMEDALFETSLADGVDEQTSSTDARKQRFFEALEKTRSRVSTANGRAIVFKLVSKTGAVHIDSGTAGNPMHRPFARVSDSTLLQAIELAADATELGGLVDHPAAGVAHASRVPGFRSYALVAELA